MEKADITAIILTFNEAIHIERCIRSVQPFVRDIIVVDSYSKDDTVTIAQALGARVLCNPWTNHAVQFQWALDHGDIQTEWILRIDADEYAEPDLEQALRKTLPTLSDDVTGLYVQRKYWFLGRWMRYGAMHPIHVLRLWRHGAGRVEQRWMDEHVVLNHGTAIALDGALTDDNRNPVSWWIAKHNEYATREMIELLNLRYRFLPQDMQLVTQQGNSGPAWKRKIKEQVYARLPLFVRPLGYFFYRYVLKLGFMDGVKGFAFNFMQALWYRSLVDLKVLEAEAWIRSCKTPEDIKTVLADKTGLKL